MKYINYFFVTIALMTGLLVSCQKELRPSEEGSRVQDAEYGTADIKVTATIEQSASTKVSLTHDPDGYLKQDWQVGDAIIGWDEPGNKYEFKIMEAADIKDGRATFTPVNGSTCIPASGRLFMVYSPGLHYWDVVGKTVRLDISNQKQGALPLLMTAVGEVNGNSLNFNFQNMMAIVGVDNPMLKDAPAHHISRMHLSVGGTTVKFSSPVNGDRIDMTVLETGTISTDCDFTTDATGNTSGVSIRFAVCPTDTPANVEINTGSEGWLRTKLHGRRIERGKYYKLQSEFEPGPTFGVFTVNPGPDGNFGTTDDVKVRFARGNVQYKASAMNGSKWKFAEHQYDFVGNTGGNTTAAANRATQSALIDLFGWGATGFGAYGHEPYSVSTDRESYITTPEGWTGEVLSIYNRCDWGYCFGGAESNWRVLNGVAKTSSHLEWDELSVLLSERDYRKRTASTVNGNKSAMFMKCNIEGINGLLLFPDKFAWPAESGSPDESTATKVNAGDADFAITYTKDEFVHLEMAGCVFLPCAGMRDGTVYTSGSGLYWFGGASTAAEAEGMRIDNSDVTSRAIDRDHGQSVRLVEPVSGTRTYPIMMEYYDGINGCGDESAVTSGTATLSSRFSPAGAIVTITIKSIASDSECIYLYANDSNRKSVYLRGSGTTVNSTREFTMPESPVYIGVRFGNKLRSGVFSVGVNKFVRFSNGILEYKAADVPEAQWHMWDYQYAFYGNQAIGGNCVPEERRAHSAGGMDLFGWGATGYNWAGQKPYSVLTTDSSYGSPYDEDLKLSYCSDWGYCVGGFNSAWRTLSKEEWEYLLFTRQNASEKWGFGKKEGVRGLWILPDDWTLPSDCSFTPRSLNYDTNKYTTLYLAMESAGAIFLPIAGVRTGTTYTSGEPGRYWTSTIGPDENTAYVVSFSTARGVEIVTAPRSNGYAVRLVKDVE